MKKPIQIGAKVKITATNKQLHDFGMQNDKINKDLKKYNADVTDVLKKASFPVNEDGTIRCKVFIINGVFTIPECYLKDITDSSVDSSADEEEIKLDVNENTDNLIKSEDEEPVKSKIDGDFDDENQSTEE